jgi:hypothetical protein
MRENQKCGNCALRNPTTQVCALFNEIISAEECCPKFTKELQICNLCGKPTLNLPILEYFNGQLIQYCDTCAQQLGHCSTCTLGQYCAFKQDTSVKEQPFIMLTFRQGNTVIQQQIKNPARIEATCKNCKCLNIEGNFCNRDFNCCDQWHFIKETEETK